MREGGRRQEGESGELECIADLELAAAAASRGLAAQPRLARRQQGAGVALRTCNRSIGKSDVSLTQPVAPEAALKEL